MIARSTSAPVPSLGPTRVLVAPDTILDARLALFHRSERWLAVADVHFGYEVSQRAAGALFPMWGMDPVEERLQALLDDYRPARLIVVGDFVHNRDARKEASGLVSRLRTALGTDGDLILVAGNHDRGAFPAAEMCEVYATEQFCFYHGDNAPPGSDVLAGRTAVIGHHHPARTLSDGAGLSLKLPAFVQADEHWVLPAFSPWAAGGGRQLGSNARYWLCSAKRILPPR